MDTRTKIISAAESAAVAAATVAAGYFDPLTAPLAERLASLKRPLLILICEPEHPILPALARAQLVAGLAAVDYVAIASLECPAATVHLESEHAAQFDALVAHVHSRQSV